MNGIRRFGPLTIFVAEPLLSEQEPLERREKANSSGARFSENRNPHHEATGPHSENPAYRAVARRIKNWPLMSLQQRLVKTGGRRIKHARYYWLLLAESHLTRRLFGGMLRRIAALPSPAGQASRRPKQISVLSETGEGKAFEEWV